MIDKPRLLVVDDEAAIRFFLTEELSQAGYTVLMAASGEEALARLQEEPVDVILLDLKMPGMDGLQFMEAIGKQPPAPAIIILTAYASLESAITAMRQGAVDYLIKPCTSRELRTSVARGLARREEELRRQELAQLIQESARKLLIPSQPKPIERQRAGASRFLEARGLLLDRERLAVIRQGQPVKLTPTEFQLLVYLMEHADQPRSFSAMAQAVHGSAEEEITARQALSTHLWRLKRKLDKGPDGKDYIVNVRGRGYMFVARETGP